MTERTKTKRYDSRRNQKNVDDERVEQLTARLSHHWEVAIQENNNESNEVGLVDSGVIHTKISRLNGGIFCCPDSLLSLKKGVYQSFKARLPKEKHYVNLNHYDVYTLYIKYPIQYFDSKDKEKFNDEAKKIDFWTLFDIF